MSYCRFQNTLTDLRDCYDALNEAGSLENAIESAGEEEAQAIKRLMKLCREITKEFNHEEEF